MKTSMHMFSDSTFVNMFVSTNSDNHI